MVDIARSIDNLLTCPKTHIIYTFQRGYVFVLPWIFLPLYLVLPDDGSAEPKHVREYTVRNNIIYINISLPYVHLVGII